MSIKTSFTGSWLQFLIIVLLSTLSSISLEAQNKVLEQLVIPLSNPEKPFKLNLVVEKATIKVVVHGGKDVIVDAEPETEKSKNAEPNPNPRPNQNANINTNTNVNTNESKKQKTHSGGGKYLVGRESNNSITLGPAGLNSELNIVIKVPKIHTTLNITTVYRGNIMMTDINGEIEINNSAGSVNLQGVSGSVVANSMAGDITVTFTHVDPKAPMAFSTLMGKIDVTFPTTFKADMKIQSDDGGLFSDYEILFGDKTPKMQKVNTAPAYRARIKGSLTGRINGGGAEILMKNMMGNIYIRKSTANPA